MELVDSHCHLDDEQFNPDRPGVIQRAREAGLKYCLSIGTGDGPPDLAVAIRQAEQHDFVYATVGVHPNDAAKVKDGTFQDLAGLLQHPKLKALGEIGLDYHWDIPKDVQMPVFLQQLEIAAAAKMPIVIHTRDAWADTLEVLRTHWAPRGLPGIMHCFSGTPAQAEASLAAGFYLSFAGNVTYPRSTGIQQVAASAPADRILVETDAPFLAPIPHRGQRNEPALVVHTAAYLANLRGISAEALANLTTANFKTLFPPVL